MRNQSHECDDFRRFDLPNGRGLSAISNRLYAGFAKTSRSTLKHYLFSSPAPKKLFRSLRGLCVKDKRVNLRKQDCFRGYLKYASQELDMYQQGRILYIAWGMRSFFIYKIHFAGTHRLLPCGLKRKGTTCCTGGACCVDQLGQFFGQPGIILADKDAMFIGKVFPPSPRRE